MSSITPINELSTPSTTRRVELLPRRRRGRPPRRDLTNLDDLAVELAMVYKMARAGRLPIDVAARLAFVLKSMAELARVRGDKRDREAELELADKIRLEAAAQREQRLLQGATFENLEVVP